VVMPVEVPVSELAKLFEGEPLVKDWKVVDLYRGESYRLVKRVLPCVCGWALKTTQSVARN